MEYLVGGIILGVFVFAPAVVMLGRFLHWLGTQYPPYGREIDQQRHRSFWS